MAGDEKPIRLAYKARAYVPVEEYRRGHRKKMYNPIRTAPALVQAMDHLGPQALPLHEARRRAKRTVQEPEAAAYIDSLGWQALKQFLSTIVLFLKTDPQWRKEKGMEKFTNRAETPLTSEQVSERALVMAGIIYRSAQSDVNRNKLKRLSAHIAAAGNKWEALSGLARFYPLRGVPQDAVDELVTALGEMDLHSFKELVAQTLIFYEATIAGWKGMEQ